MDPKISIVIPIYNVENYLEKCINSILNQEFDDYELILINDGSRDKSEEICKKYEKIDNRIKFINKINGGVSSARNLGLSIAKGEFICFIDADDQILPNYFVTFYDIAIKNNCDIVIAGYGFNNNENIVIPSFKKNTVLEGKELILTSNNVHTSNDLCFPWRYFYRLSLINTNNIIFDENINIGEDTIFNMECILNSKRVIATDKVVYRYTVDNPNSAMRAKHKSNLEKCLLLQYDKRYRLTEEFSLNKNNNYVTDMANYYINNILIGMINNVKNSDSSNKKDDIKRIINYKMFRRSFSELGFKKQGYSIREYILYLFIKFKIYFAINYILKIK